MTEARDAVTLASAYVANNMGAGSDLPALIASVHGALTGLSAPAPTAEPERPQPAVPAKKPITPDHLISLEDGKPYKTLKRHLTRLGMTPQQYRKKWGLPSNYPMTAANYAKRRSELARTMGLGRRPCVSEPADAVLGGVDV